MTTPAAAARQLAKLLQRNDLKVVFAESCTGGLIAASLSTVPGISEYFCGSAVTYRSDTKHEWLDVSRDKLSRPGAVSAVVAREMAAGVLTATPEADWAASVTGHLGPNAPRRLDGVIYVGIAGEAIDKARAVRYVLAQDSRTRRQREAATIVIRQLINTIDEACV